MGKGFWGGYADSAIDSHQDRGKRMKQDMRDKSEEPASGLPERTGGQSEAPSTDRETKLDQEVSGSPTANLVHDIRTPLVAVRGYAKMLLEEREGPLNGTQREYLAIVVENANRMIRVLKDFEN